ncbi:roadblock/LC7 domain-containing protein [Streptomyces sp. NPDC088354]|uniref:roadblock/LC7 domain-containing protein n=1 Tax=unclassified Streptomyces TaxID=2593676 RepID=UPI0029B5F567|nr:roadblock/LC7 domain-containing protein [Streptomyces sp. MI02-7b]MDX3073298.1 roadblock/LC7 domain-containing protein [Streptomyces sp. MI02-7b]
MSARTDTQSERDLSHEARNLQWLLRNFVDDVPGVRSVAVVSSDGLLLLNSESDEPDAPDDPAGAADASGQSADDDDDTAAGPPKGPAGTFADLATVVSGIASLTDGAARLMEGGGVRQTAVAMENGSVFVMSISDGSLLGVHADAECDMSIVAYHMALFVGRAGHVLTPQLRTELRQAIEGAR